MNILVTGGAGYIGSHTCVQLLEAGYNVTVLDNLDNSCEISLQRVEEITGKKIKFYKVDLLDYDATNAVFDENKFDAVIHFAGLKAVGDSVKYPIRYYHNNITGTLNLCDVMSKHGVKKIVFSSSATVYGEPPSVPIEEHFPHSPESPYGRTKHMVEEILKDIYTSDNEWDIAILRYFNPVGAHESGKIGEDPSGIPNNLMPYISQVAIGKLEYLSVFGDDYDTKDGTGVRDYIHVVDLANGHLKALDKIKNSVGVVVYNLGTGVGYSVIDMVKAFSKASGIDIKYKIADRRPGDIASYYADPSKAREELGFEAQYSLEDMCRDSWKWQSQNPNGYKN